MLFQFGSKNCFVVNRSKGTSEITPNTNKVARYLALLLVLKKPSTSKNAMYFNCAPDNTLILFFMALTSVSIY